MANNSQNNDAYNQMRQLYGAITNTGQNALNTNAFLSSMATPKNMGGALDQYNQGIGASAQQSAMVPEIGGMTAPAMLNINHMLATPKASNTNYGQAFVESPYAPEALAAQQQIYNQQAQSEAMLGAQGLQKLTAFSDLANSPVNVQSANPIGQSIIGKAVVGMPGDIASAIQAIRAANPGASEMEILQHAQELGLAPATNLPTNQELAAKQQQAAKLGLNLDTSTSPQQQQQTWAKFVNANAGSFNQQALQQNMRVYNNLNSALTALKSGNQSSYTSGLLAAAGTLLGNPNLTLDPKTNKIIDRASGIEQTGALKSALANATATYAPDGTPMQGFDASQLFGQNKDGSVTLASNISAPLANFLDAQKTKIGYQLAAQNPVAMNRVISAGGNGTTLGATPAMAAANKVGTDQFNAFAKNAQSFNDAWLKQHPGETSVPSQIQQDFAAFDQRGLTGDNYNRGLHILLNRPPVTGGNNGQ